MAIEDWLNNQFIGNLTGGQAVNSAIDFYDQWQRREGANDSIDAITAGYDQGIDYLKQTADESKGVLGDVYQTDVGNYDPYIGAGKTALDEYMGLMSDPSSITSDPGYQWRLKQGQEAVTRGLEGAGYADPMGSGAHPIGITEYAQGHATNELDSAMKRRLAPMELGMQGVQGLSESGANYGGNISRINQYMGPAVANMYGSRADALATKDLIDAQAMSGFLGQGQGLLQSIMGGGGGSGGGSGGSGGGSGGSSPQSILQRIANNVSGNETNPLLQFIGMVGNNPENMAMLEQLAIDQGMTDGPFGEGSWFEGLDQILNASDWDIQQLNNLWDNAPAVQALADTMSWGSNNPTGDMYGPGSWFEGLNDPDLMDALNLPDDGFWAGITDALSDFGSTIGDWGSSVVNWIGSLNPFR